MKVCEFCNCDFNKKTKFCSRECYLSSIRTHNFILKQCSYCNNDIEKDSINIKKNKTLNVFCDKKCAALHRWKNNKSKDITKPCSWCGQILIKKLYKLNNNITDNIFCNKKCANRFNQSIKRKNRLCLKCKNIFTTFIDQNEKSYRSNPRKYCFKCSHFGSNGIGISNETYVISPRRGVLKTMRVNIECKTCNKIIQRKNNTVEKSINKNFFCCKSCSSKHTNKHRVQKRYGCRISKMEKFIQKQLLEKYYNLDFLFNFKEVIGRELDVHIPKLNIAFEINGPFHYRPIFGQDKLNRIKNNDDYKKKLCLLYNIELHVIDTSSVLYFTERSSYKYLSVITSIIDSKLEHLNQPDQTC